MRAKGIKLINKKENGKPSRAAYLILEFYLNEILEFLLFLT